MMEAVRAATSAYLEVREASNKNYREGACTYGELKAAINNAGYVMDEVRKAAGLLPWALSDETEEYTNGIQG